MAISTFFCGPTFVQKKVESENQDKKPSLDASKQLRTTMIVIAVVAALAAVLGGLVFAGVMNVGVSGLGVISPSTAFWMIAGGGAGAIAMLALVAVQAGVMKHRVSPPKGDL